MTTETDLGARCDRHVGEVYPPRCDDCAAANRELEADQRQERHERALQRNAALGLNPKPQTVRRPVYRHRR